MPTDLRLLLYFATTPPTTSAPSRPGVLFSLGPIAITQATAQRVIAIVVTIVLAAVLLRLVPVLERVILRWAGRSTRAGSATASTIDAHQRIETLTRVTSSAARAVIWTITVITVAGHVGVAIAPLLAGAGIAGVAIGFGAQSIVRDFFAGFFILLENQFAVGDTVTIGQVTGTVEQMTLRVTLVRDAQGTAYFIPNSNITNVANRTQGHGRAVVEATFAWNVSEDDVRAVLEGATRRLASREDYKELFPHDMRIEGPSELVAGGVVWRLVAVTVPAGATEVRAAMISAFTAELHAGDYAPVANLITRTKPVQSHPPA